MAPWDPLDALSSLGPPGPPNRPPQTHKQVSWPHCTLKITSPASQITFTFNPVTDVAPSPLSPLSPSSFFLLPSSFFLRPSSFFLLPSSFFLLPSSFPPSP